MLGVVVEHTLAEAVSAAMPAVADAALEIINAIRAGDNDWDTDVGDADISGTRPEGASLVTANVLHTPNYGVIAFAIWEFDDASKMPGIGHADAVRAFEPGDRPCLVQIGYDTICARGVTSAAADITDMNGLFEVLSATIDRIVGSHSKSASDAIAEGRFAPGGEE
jgi:hypothetical protein